MKVLFIYNPHAGHMQIKNQLYDIVNTLSNTYDDLKIYASRNQKDIFNFVKNNGTKYDLIIVSGGDGSLSEAVNGLMNLKKKPKLGYIPAGSTNDYANSLKLPKDMKKCALTLTNPKEEKQIDIGKFNDNYFVYVAAFGAFTEVSYSTPQDVKNVIGHLAYFLNGITSITKIKSYNMKFKYDGNEIEDKFIFGMVTNSLSIGGLYSLNNRNVKLDDGLFEVMLVKEPKDIIELQQITAYLINPKLKTNLVTTFKTSKLIIETANKVSWTLDGEYGGSPNKINIVNKNKTITLIK